MRPASSPFGPSKLAIATMQAGGAAISAGTNDFFPRRLVLPVGPVFVDEDGDIQPIIVSKKDIPAPKYSRSYAIHILWIMPSENEGFNFN